MPPQLALLVTFLFIIYLFRRDRQIEKAETGLKNSAAIWIPTVWLMILGSRSVSHWLNLGSSPGEMDELWEGSYTNLAVYAFLILAACVVLFRRKIRWGDLIRNNSWLVLFFLYCAVSVLWADYPFDSLKKWIKGLGDPLMALILISDPMPAKAVENVIKKCAYVLLPLSIVFIKYFPNIGRGYSFWTGAAYYIGVTTNKNLLGFLLFVFGLYFLSALFGRGARQRFAGKRGDLVVAIAFTLMVFYLFNVSDSKTPLLTLLIGMVVVVGFRFQFMRAHLFAVILTCVAVERLVPISDMVIASAGRDSTLTGRTEVWASVLRLRVNDFVGAGFESFWTGDRLRALWAEFAFKPTQAHNGFIEIFVNLGVIGLVIWVAVLFTTFRRIRRKAVAFAASADAAIRTDELIFSTLSMGYFVGFMMYNITEALFKALNFLFIVFLILSIEYPRNSVDPPTLPSRVRRSTKDERKRQPERASVPA